MRRLGCLGKVSIGCDHEGHRSDFWSSYYSKLGAVLWQDVLGIGGEGY